MMVRLFLTLGIGASLAAADTVVLTNGDRLTGDIQKLEKEKLFLKTAYAGSIGIDWKMVDKLESSRTYKIETQSGLRFQGTLDNSDAGFEIIDETSRTKVAPLNVVSIQPAVEDESEGFWSSLEGGADVGYSFA